MESCKITLQKMGKHIAKVRKEKGFTQKNLSEALLVGDKTVSKWERGIIAPDITILKKLADTLGISLEELLSGEKITSQENKVNATVSAINVYSNQTKKKYFKRLSIVILALLFIFLTIFIVERHYRWDINKFTNDGEFYVSGYTFSNEIETKIVLDNITFFDDNAGTSLEVVTNMIEIGLYSNDVLLCSSGFTFDTNYSLREFFTNYNYACETDKDVDLNNLSLHILYNENDNPIYSVLKLK